MVPYTTSMDDLFVLLLISIIAAISFLYKSYLYNVNTKYHILQPNHNIITANSLPDSIQSIINNIFTDLNQSNANQHQHHNTNKAVHTSSLATTSPLIYAAIQELIDHIITNFIAVWYYKINVDASPLFISELRQSLNYISNRIATRCSTIDWSRFVVKHIIMQLTYLLKVFRLTKTELMSHNELYCSMTELQQQELLSQQVHSCYQLHPACTDRVTYTRKLCAALLSQLLQPNDFNCTILSVLCREILTFNVLQPAMNFIQPFWVNTLIVKSLSKVNASVIATIDHTNPRQTVQQVVNQVLEMSGDERAAMKHAELDQQYNSSTTTNSYRHHSGERSNNINVVHTNNHTSGHNLTVPNTDSNNNDSTYDVHSPTPSVDRQRSKSHDMLAPLYENDQSAKSPHDSSLSRSVSHNNINNDIVNDLEPIRSTWYDIWSLRIGSADIRFDMNKKPYVSYTIHVTHHPTNQHWSISKRYSEFLKLHKKLKRQLNIIDTTMPKKHIFDDHLSQSFIQQRRDELAQFITQLSWNKKIQHSDIFMKFLTPVSKQNTSTTTNRHNQSLSTASNTTQPFSPTSFSRLHSTVSNDILNRHLSHHSNSSSPSRNTSHTRVPSDDHDLPNYLSPSNIVAQQRAAYIRKSSSTNDLAKLQHNHNNNINSSSDPVNLHHSVPSIDPSTTTLSTNTSAVHATAVNQPESAAQSSKSRLLYYKNEFNESPELTQPLVALVEEILDLNSKGYIGRKAVYVVKNIIKLTMSTFIHSWVSHSVSTTLNESQCVKLINTINKLVFPNGRLFVPSRPPTEDEKNTIKLKAQDLLVHELPASIKTLLGTQHCQIALLRVFQFLQTDTLLQHLAYSVLDALILEVFPELSKL